MQDNVYEPVWATTGKSAEEIQIPRVPTAWKFATVLSGVILLIGYLMLAAVFQDSSTNLHVNSTATSAIAFLFIGVSYASSIVIAFFQRSSKAFLLSSVFLPYLIINFIALFNNIFNIIARDLFPLNVVRVISIGLPGTFILIYALTSFLIYRDFCAGEINRGGASGMPLLNEGERQRQHFARLLESRNASAPSPELIQNTYRLDLPNLERTQTDRTRS